MESYECHLSMSDIAVAGHGRCKRCVSIIGLVLLLPILGMILVFHSAALAQEPSQHSSEPSNFTVVDDTLFFTADDGWGPGLWKSDGTAEGTVLVKSGWSGSPRALTDVGGTLFFVANDGATGRELWKSDATPQGTVLVKDIWPEEPGAFPWAGGFDELTDFNGLLFFVADDGVTGRGLWKSDGTPQGTVLLTDGVTPSQLTLFKGALFFEGTHENSRGLNESELWKSDGTSGGTVLVKDLRPDPDDWFAGELYQLTVVNDTLFFATWLPEMSIELCKSDGTPEGTVLVREILEGMDSPGYMELTDVNGTLFFTVSNPSPAIWKSDGTAEGTVLVKSGWSGSPRALTDVGGTLFFVANVAGDGLWKSDGTAEGTDFVKDIEDISGPSPLTIVNGVLYLTTRTEIWTSDGTPVGTVPLREVLGQPETWRSEQPTAWGDRVVFSAYDDAHGWEPWVSDGTPDGTHLLKNIWPDRVEFRRGDVNGDGTVDVSDGMCIFSCRSGWGCSFVSCDDAADANDDGIFNLADGFVVFHYLFRGGNPPPEPGPDNPGLDPTDDDLDCAAYEPAPPPTLASFTLGFESPVKILEQSDDRITYQVFATLTTTENTRGWSAEAWSIDVGIEGAKSLSVGIDGTLAGELYELNGGYHWSETVGDGEGVVSVVELLFGSSSVPLPPEGTASIAAITLEVTEPGDTIREVHLRYIDGLQGSGQPVKNVITLGGYSHAPQLENLVFFVNDCNGNGVPDADDITAGVSEDCNGNGVPDECSDGNGIPDECKTHFLRGDCNDDGNVDISDGINILGHLFLGDDLPPCLDAADANDDGVVDMSDAVGLFSFLFLGGSEPATPGPFECGADATDDDPLGCETYNDCS